MFYSYFIMNPGYGSSIFLNIKTKCHFPRIHSFDRCLSGNLVNDDSTNQIRGFAKKKHCKMSSSIC